LENKRLPKPAFDKLSVLVGVGAPLTLDEIQMHAFSVAVSGHRPNRMRLGSVEISRRLKEVLSALRSGAKGWPRRAVSPLAEGSDRLFAEAAIELGYELHALLPFKCADYESTFSDIDATPRFRALLDVAKSVRELPGKLTDTKAAYEACGRATVGLCDLLVTVWDGKVGAGRGGTPQIVEYAVLQGRPVIWVDAARQRLPMRIPESPALGLHELRLAKLARSSIPLFRQNVVTLATSVTRNRGKYTKPRSLSLNG